MSKTPTETQPAERRAYRVNEFCQAYRVSRDTAYKLMRSGKLKYFSVGTERRISVEAAQALARRRDSPCPLANGAGVGDRR
jgi:excisionase family DNA binding protein